MTAGAADEVARQMAGWEAYREEVWNFANYRRDIPGGQPAWLSYLANGLCGEVSELGDAPPTAHLGEFADVVWHLATIERQTGLSAAWPIHADGAESSAAHFDMRRGASGSFFEMLMGAGRVAECLKRPIRGRPIDAGRLQRALNGLATGVWATARFFYGGVDVVTRASLAKVREEFGGRPWSVALLAERDAARGVARPAVAVDVGDAATALLALCERGGVEARLALHETPDGDVPVVQIRLGDQWASVSPMVYPPRGVVG